VNPPSPTPYDSGGHADFSLSRNGEPGKTRIACLSSRPGRTAAPAPAGAGTAPGSQDGNKEAESGGDGEGIAGTVVVIVQGAEGKTVSSIAAEVAARSQAGDTGGLAAGAGPGAADLGIDCLSRNQPVEQRRRRRRPRSVPLLHPGDLSGAFGDTAARYHRHGERQRPQLADCLVEIRSSPSPPSEPTNTPPALQVSSVADPGGEGVGAPLRVTVGRVSAVTPEGSGDGVGGGGESASGRRSPEHVCLWS